MKENLQQGGLKKKYRTAKHKESIWSKISRFMCSNSLEAYGFSKRDIKRVLKETR